jgi:hypothetical protein
MSRNIIENYRQVGQRIVLGSVCAWFHFSSSHVRTFPPESRHAGMGSSVGMATYYTLRINWGLIPGSGQTGSGAHPAAYPIDTG